jgi:hypothetical protein
VLLERTLLLRVERVQRVGGAQFVNSLAFH